MKNWWCVPTNIRHWKKRRAQSSLEFLVLTSAMVIGVASVIIIAQGILTQAIVDKHEATLAAIEDAIVREIALAGRAVEGYERTFTLAATIDGEEVAVAIIEETPPRADALLLSWRNSSRVRFLAEEVNGTLGLGVNTIRVNGNGSIIVNATG
jgi:hypothetical protein